MAQVNLGHVKGDKGDTGSQGQQGVPGIQGPAGPAGPGCPTGGTAGQVLMKDSGTDYDYEWSDINFATHREIPLAVGTNAWTLSSGVYTAEFTSAYITDSCKWELVWDESYRSYAKADILVDKKTGGGGLTLKTTTIPTGTITGTVTVIDPNDGKIPVIIEDTVVPIANGGTGQSTVAGVRSAFSIPDVVDNLTTNDGTKALSAKQGYTLNGKINGTEIPANEDLNNYKTPGFYYSTSSANASSLSNRPSDLTIAFTMVVMAKSSSTYNQVIYAYGTNGGGTYERTSTSAGWQPWYSTELELRNTTATMGNVKKGVVNGSSSANITITLPAFVSVGRRSSTTTSATAFIDSWGGIVSIATSNSFSIAYDNNTITITNGLQANASYIVVY